MHAFVTLDNIVRIRPLAVVSAVLRAATAADYHRRAHNYKEFVVLTFDTSC